MKNIIFLLFLGLISGCGCRNVEKVVPKEGMVVEFNGVTFVASYYYVENDRILFSPLFIYVGEDGFPSIDQMKPEVDSEADSTRLFAEDFLFTEDPGLVVFFGKEKILMKLETGWSPNEFSDDDLEGLAANFLTND